MKRTGSSSRIEDFSRPLASAAFEGITTLRPGTAQNQASKFCECWAPLGPPAPHIVRIVSGSEWPVK